jgi:hypothetical protein
MTALLCEVGGYGFMLINNLRCFCMGQTFERDNTCVTYPGQANQFNKAARFLANFWR